MDEAHGQPQVPVDSEQVRVGAYWCFCFLAHHLDVALGLSPWWPLPT